MLVNSYPHDISSAGFSILLAVSPHLQGLQGDRSRWRRLCRRNRRRFRGWRGGWRGWGLLKIPAICLGDIRSDNIGSFPGAILMAIGASRNSGSLTNHGWMGWSRDGVYPQNMWPNFDEHGDRPSKLGGNPLWDNPIKLLFGQEMWWEWRRFRQ